MEAHAVVLFSGGIGSWAAAHRADAEGYDVDLLFTDTLIEDDDLYRFLLEGAADIVGGEPTEILALVKDLPPADEAHMEERGSILLLASHLTRVYVPRLHWIMDGRSPWQVFGDEKMIGNTRADICSRILKRDLAQNWIDGRWPEGTTVVMGIDWTEIHRYERAKPRWEPHQLIAPMTRPALLSKGEMEQWGSDRGLQPPRLYEMGFPHNNCGGFCIKQGQAAFVHLLTTMPERYAEHEAQEDAFRARTGKDVAILRDRRGGETRPLTLRQLRKDYQAQPEQLTLDDWGGCGCMMD